MPQAAERVRPGRRFQKIEATVFIFARFTERRTQLLRHRSFEEISELGVSVEHLLELPPQFGIAGASRFKKCSSLGHGVRFQSCEKQCFQLRRITDCNAPASDCLSVYNAPNRTETPHAGPFFSRELSGSTLESSTYSQVRA